MSLNSDLGLQVNVWEEAHGLETELVTKEKPERFPLSPATRGCHRQNSDSVCAGIVTVKDQTETQPYLVAAAAAGGEVGQVRGHINAGTLEFWKGLLSFSSGTPTK